MVQKLLKPTNDYVFKRIFGYVGNEEITKGFLNAILDEEVKSVKLYRFEKNSNCVGYKV